MTTKVWIAGMTLAAKVKVKKSYLKYDFFTLIFASMVIPIIYRFCNLQLLREPFDKSLKDMFIECNDVFYSYCLKKQIFICVMLEFYIK